MSDTPPMLRFAGDCQRLLGSRSFRRLAGKTQVVSVPESPLLRTRLTHTLDVSSMAREIARGLDLIEPLVEAIALGHDIGHPAFGHAGERALAAILPGGFHHASHGVRVVTFLESGLELSSEVVEGILKHSKGKAGTVFARGGGLASLTREALVVRAADLFAYACHDLDDAYLLGELRPRDLPARVVAVLGAAPSEIRRRLVEKTVQSSLARGEVSLDADAEGALAELRSFLYQRLYEAPRIGKQTNFVRALFEFTWEAACERASEFDEALGRLSVAPLEPERPAEAFVDAVAALTDRQALELARSLRPPPRLWSLPVFRRAS